MRRLLVLLAFLGLCAACTGSDEDGSDPTAARTVGEAGPSLPGGAEFPDFNPNSPEPPQLVFTRGDEALTLTAFTYCWSPEGAEAGICADGEPPTDPPTIGGSGPISLFFPAESFQFESRIFDAAYENGRPGPRLTQLDRRWELDIVGETPAIVEVFGFDDLNDVIVSFRVE